MLHCMAGDREKYHMTRDILVTAPGLATAGVRILEGAGARITFVRSFADHEGLAHSLATRPVEAIISRTMPLTDDLFARCPTLKVICKHGTGTSNIDMAAAERRGIAVFSTPGANAGAVAEFTIGLMVAAVRRIPRFDRNLRADSWDRAGDGTELSGRTLALLGFGRIARQVARIAQAFDMRVIAHDPMVAPEAMLAEAVTPMPDLATLLAGAEVLSLHCPALRGAPPILDASALAHLPRGAVLINTARGELVDEAALLAALDAGHLSAAALDTFATEPLGEGPLRHHPAVVLTPHVAGSTVEALGRMAERAAKVVLAYLDARENARPLPPDLAALCLNPAALARSPDLQVS